MTRLKHLIEALFLLLLLGIFKLMPTEMASNVGGYLGRKIGPRTGAARTALKNLKRAFPEKSKEDIERIHLAMWDNLGRVIAEYPHMRTIAEKYCEIENKDQLTSIANSDKPAIIIGLHQANWEVAAMLLRNVPNMNLGSVYREPNNPYAAKILNLLRDYKDEEPSFAKSKSGMRDMMKHLKAKGRIGLLIDQKYNEGIEATFFGQPAMTSTAFIDLAKKFDCPVLLVKMNRIRSCYFKFTVEEILKLDFSNTQQSIENTHRTIEGWISAEPEEWLWVHKRWKDNKTGNQSASK